VYSNPQTSIFPLQKLEFHTHTGTALFPAQFALNYEFVDTEQGKKENGERNLTKF